VADNPAIGFLEVAAMSDSPSAIPPVKARVRLPFRISAYFVGLFLVLVAVATFLPKKESVCACNGADDEAFFRQAIGASSMDYKDRFNNGFPPTLEVLRHPVSGPPTCAESDLGPRRVLNGVWGLRDRRQYYSIEYRPGPAVAKPAPGCPPGVESFTAVAVPLIRTKDSSKSFFLDETGVISID
jgi:hypothetical protein